MIIQVHLICVVTIFIVVYKKEDLEAAVLSDVVIEHSNPGGKATWPFT